MENNSSPESSEKIVKQNGIVSNQLSEDGITNESLGNDHIGVEILSVKPEKLYEAISTLKGYGFNYLQCQGGYDEGPGKCLVSFYHLISLGDIQDIKEIKEIRVKVFLNRDSDYLYLAFIKFSREVIGKKGKPTTCLESILLIIQIQQDS